MTHCAKMFNWGFFPIGKVVLLRDYFGALDVFNSNLLLRLVITVEGLYLNGCRAAPGNSLCFENTHGASRNDGASK